MNEDYLEADETNDFLYDDEDSMQTMYDRTHRMGHYAHGDVGTDDQGMPRYQQYGRRNSLLHLRNIAFDRHNAMCRLGRSVI